MFCPGFLTFWDKFQAISGPGQIKFKSPGFPCLAGNPVVIQPCLHANSWSSMMSVLPSNVNVKHWIYLPAAMTTCVSAQNLQTETTFLKSHFVHLSVFNQSTKTTCLHWPYLIYKTFLRHVKELWQNLHLQVVK